MDVYPDLAFALRVMRPRSAAGRLFSRVSRFALHGSDAVVSLGESMSQRLRAKGVGNVHTVHNWSDGDSIRALPASHSALRNEWGWGDRFVLLYSGNMGLAHEFETVLDAAQALQQRPRFLLAFVGGGPRRAEVEAEVCRRGLSNVDFRPYVTRERLGDCLGAGDAHLVTLRDGLEGMLVPSKIYGILAAGRPTLYIGPERGEIADIIRAGRCGSRVAPGDDGALVEAIRGYLDDRRLGEEQGLRARELFDQRFSRQRALDAFQRLIEAETSPSRTNERSGADRA
jgi:glycosyltransferase involved in cell wall biosynthesis